MKLVVAVVLAGGCLSTPAAPPACGAPHEFDDMKIGGALYSPWLSDDRLELFYVSAGPVGPLIFQTRRQTTEEQFEPGTMLGVDITFDPWVSDDGLTLWYVEGDSNNGGTPHESHRTALDEDFAPGPVAFPELAMPLLHPSLTRDRRTIYYARSESGGGSHDIFYRTRASDSATWGDEQIAIATPGVDEGGAAIDPEGDVLTYYSGPTLDVSAIYSATRGDDFQDATPRVPHLEGTNEGTGMVLGDGRTTLFHSNRTGQSRLWAYCD